MKCLYLYQFSRWLVYSVNKMFIASFHWVKKKEIKFYGKKWIMTRIKYSKEYCVELFEGILTQYLLLHQLSKYVGYKQYKFFVDKQRNYF